MKTKQIKLSTFLVTFLVTASLASFLLQSCKKTTSINPESLESVKQPMRALFYYSFPSLVNSSNGDINNAINVFKQFDIIVFASPIQQTTHPDHLKTKSIIDGLNKLGKKVYGYIALGNRSGDTRLTDVQLRSNIDLWKSMGVIGVFGDEFDSGFNVDRTRQNIFIDYAHEQKLSVFANGFNVDDILKDSKLGTGDYYLLESFGYGYGKYRPFEETIKRGISSREYSKKSGVGIISISSTGVIKTPTNVHTTEPFLHGYFASLLFNFEGFGFSDEYYSASGPNGANVFVYPNITPSHGNKFMIGKIAEKQSETKYITETDTYKIILTDKTGYLEKK